MAEDGKVTIKMLLDKSKFNKDINESKETASKAFKSVASTGTAAFKTAGSAGVLAFKGMATAGETAFKAVHKTGTTAFKGIVAGAGVAAAGIGLLMKKSITDYGEYEQLVGGVETLFKKSSSRVIEYANNAYKTAGVSANEYMSTVTSFSASLLQGLGGDTQKAADKANMALTDMSDNANKMGTDMYMIQNTYQGLAKQNYTMLDNLKLGYGGTGAEMARLVNESGVLGKKLKVDAESVKDISFDKLLDAIHVVQTRMGITGTTAKEAASTIQGSVNTMKSAWENFSTGLADPSQNISKLADNLVDSVVNVGKNIIPRLKILSPGVIKGFRELIKIAAPEIGGMLATAIQTGINFIPQLINFGDKVLEQFIDRLGGNSKQFANKAEKIITTLFSSVLKSAKELSPMLSDIVPMVISAMANYESTAIQLGAEMVVALATGIVDNADTIANSIIIAVETIANTLLNPDSVDKVLAAATSLIDRLSEGLLSPENIDKTAESAAKIVTSVADFLIQSADKLLPAALQMITSFAAYLLSDEGTTKLVDGVYQVIDTIVTALSDTTQIKKITQGAIDLISKLADGLGKNGDDIGTAMGAVVDTIIKTVTSKDNIKKLYNAGKNILIGIFDGIGAALREILGGKAFDEIMNHMQKSGGWANIPTSWLPHATGLSRVPYDKYPALLHEDEKILTKPQANQYDQIVTMSLGAIAQFSRMSSMSVGIGRSQQGNTEVASAINRMSNAISKQGTGSGNQTCVANLILNETNLGKAVFKLNRVQTQRVGTQVIGVQTYDL